MLSTHQLLERATLRDTKAINKKRNTLIAIFLIASVLILLLPVVLTHRGCQFWDLTGAESAHIGDTLYGITGPFLAIGAAVLTFYAFWVQYVYNIELKDDLTVERFEHNLFEMISHQEAITNALSIEIDEDIDGGISAIPQIYKLTGREVFEALYTMYIVKVYYTVEGDYVPKAEEYVGLKEMLQKDGEAFKHYVENKSVGRLDHYFRHLYHIFKYISETGFTDKEKYRYASIVRSNLSQYELVLLYYNCLSPNGLEKFKPLVEDYALLNNLRANLLAKEEERRLYKQKMLYGYTERQNLPQSEYSVRAFRYSENNGNGA